MNINKKNHISILSRVRNSNFEGANSVSKFATIVNSSLGFGSYVSSFSKLNNCKIGRYSSIAPKVQVVFGNHPTNKFISTHPAFYSIRTPTGFSYVSHMLFSEFEYADKEKKYYVEIGNDVWVGYNTLLIAGIRIGDGAIIAAGAVVTKNVPAYAVVGGIPARVIKYRFETDEIDWLLKLKWWEKDMDWISEHAKYFTDIEKLKQILESERM
ncbi:CatB-related O-acetyltransferase [Paenibacillus koleovorans]|uniref:CatB-related O-acetyltransferase n=1 Tax=Paenibacillus koleovorans TaxID=121608 RepID=UPI000FDA759A|nr:CatB-related O-acetyltransferase [Paenibacillus koleovorans]